MPPTPAVRLRKGRNEPAGDVGHAGLCQLLTLFAYALGPLALLLAAVSRGAYGSGYIKPRTRTKPLALAADDLGNESL